jgi:serine/threonine protein kinase/Tfp pilus assembly protein PilF
MNISPDRYRLISTVFQEAQEKPLQDRDAFIRTRCSGDTELESQVRSLLLHDDSIADAFSEDHLGAAMEDFAAVDASNQMPEQIGSYRVIRLIGQGGMGQVYEAEQENPRRKVAIKVIRPELESSSIARRFALEVQILGTLHHPAIALVHEAGTYLQSGKRRSFFAMEFIEGTPLLAYVGQAKLSSRQRLALLAVISDGVAHAHMHGVVHRDLKPSNILVDTKGGPKILDFGVARLLNTDTTQHTLTGQVVGTVAYMSPEQLAGGSSLDFRADVFALGVIGYQLLTGRLPVEISDLPLAEAARRITERDPAPLSTISRELRGDVEAIIGKCLEKDPNRRYATASDLAADLRAFLENQPIKARRPTKAYQLRRFAQRNPGLVTGIAIAFVALVAGTAVSLVQAYKATESEKLARMELSRANSVKKVISDLLTSVRPEEAAGLDTKLMRRILDNTAKRLETEGATDPLIEAELRYIVGDAYRIIGEYTAGRSMLERSMTLRREHLGNDHPDTLASINQFGLLLMESGKPAEAEPLMREALEARRRLFGEDSLETIQSSDSLASITWLKGDPKGAEAGLMAGLERRRKLRGENDPQFLASMLNIGALQYALGNPERSQQYLQQGLDGLRKVLGTDDPLTLRAMRSLGLVLKDMNKLEEAEKTCREAVEATTRISGADHPDTLSAINFLALVVESAGKMDEAEKLYRQALDGRRRRLTDNHADTLEAMNNLANHLRDREKYDEAHALYKECLERRRVVLGADNQDTLWSMSNMGSILIRMGKPEEAIPVSLEALEGRKKVLGPEAPLTIESVTRMGVLYNQVGRAQDAVDLMRASEPSARKLWEARGTRSLANYLAEYGQALATTSQFPLAEKALVDAQRIYVTSSGAGNNRTLTCNERLVAMYTAWAKADAAGGHEASAQKWQQEIEARRAENAAAQAPK